ncbi:MAG: hypothetical protein DWI00_05570 [Planctomycetota bacterium]|nr:MAG: hypothetical protein DWI00_05570 [Planctomycetota bacterium]
MNDLRSAIIPKWRLPLIVVLVAVGLGVTLVYFRSPPPVKLLLITLDTTRADRLGCYGCTQALSPELDALAKKEVLFERAYAPAPMTSPSHTSIRTGLWPPEHGVNTNALTVLDRNVPTTAELLQARGYATAAFPAASMLAARFGLNRGFQSYFDDRQRLPTHLQNPDLRSPDSTIDIPAAGNTTLQLQILAKLPK